MHDLPAKVLTQLYARLHRHRHISIAVVLLAFILIRVPDIPTWIYAIRYNGMDSEKLRDILTDLFASLISIGVFVIIFGVGVRSASEVIGKPQRFLLILLIAATVASASGREVSTLLGGRQFWQGDIRATANLVDIWMRHLIGGALFGWLYFLYRQRSEDAEHFSGVLLRRSILLRQIAQSRLVTTRAQIDPELVARVLHKVRQCQQHEPQRSLGLLNHMISYLRLAMNRLREPSSSISTELALCTAYCALQQAHTGVVIDLHADGGSSLRDTPVFLIVRQLLNSVLQTAADAIAMRIITSNHRVEISAAIGAAHLSEDQQSTLKNGLDEFLSGHTVSIRCLAESGNNRYLLQISRS